MTTGSLEFRLWNTLQEAATRSYRNAWAPLMRDVLWDARQGLLSHDWRSTITTRRRSRSFADERTPNLPEWLTDAKELSV